MASGAKPKLAMARSPRQTTISSIYSRMGIEIMSQEGIDPPDAVSFGAFRLITARQLASGCIRIRCEVVKQLINSSSGR